MYKNLIPLVTAKEISEDISVPVRTIYSWAETGEIPAIKIRTRWLFPKKLVFESLQERMEEQNKCPEQDLRNRTYGKTRTSGTSNIMMKGKNESGRQQKSGRMTQRENEKLGSYWSAVLKKLNAEES